MDRIDDQYLKRALSACTGIGYTKDENETHVREAVATSRHDVTSEFTGLQTDDGLHNSYGEGAVQLALNVATT